jgi:hypothetical protein
VRRGSSLRSSVRTLIAEFLSLHRIVRLLMQMRGEFIAACVQRIGARMWLP